MHVKNLLFILFALTITGCEKNYEITLPEESNKVVLNLLINRDSAMLARVTLSGRMNGSQNLPELSNATVNLYENGAFKETLAPYVMHSRTYYRSKTIPQSGASYRVTAVAPGYTEVSGSDHVPDTAKVGELKMTVAQVNNYQAKTTVSVQVHDDAAVQNYYRFRIYQINEWVNGNGTRGSQKIQQYFEMEETNLSVFNDATSSDFYTNDALFNGRSPRFVFRINSDGRLHKMLIEITSLTYDSYNYLNSVHLAYEKNDDGFSEKVIIYNNIENGLGIIGGVAQREYLLTR